MTGSMTRKRKRGVKTQNADQSTATGRASKSATKGDSDYENNPTVPVIDSTIGNRKEAVKAEDVDPRIIIAGKGVQNLGNLSAFADYSGLKSLLQAHFAVKSTEQKLPIEAAVTLSMNDFECRENAIGEFFFQSFSIR